MPEDVRIASSVAMRDGDLGDRRPPLSLSLPRKGGGDDEGECDGPCDLVPNRGVPIRKAAESGIPSPLVGEGQGEGCGTARPTSSDERAAPHATASRLLRFAFVGGLGFLVDAGLTQGLVLAGTGPLTARVFGVGLAILATWLLNRTVTFASAPAGRGLFAEGGRYLAVALTGTAVNYLTFAAAITLVPALPAFLAVAAGSAVAMGVTYAGYARLVFGRSHGA